MKIFDQNGTPITAPEGVGYVGSRGVGSFLVLRFQSKFEYVDRYFNQSGEEKFRESGEILPPPTPKPGLWRRLWGN